MLVHHARSRSLSVLGALVIAGCVAKGPEAVSVHAGPGIKVDPSTQAISIDQATVPMLPTCATGQFVTHSADGNWQCVTPAQVTDAQTVGGKPASYFLPATAKAADTALLNGKADTAFLAAGGTAANASLLNGKADTAFLPVGGKAVSAGTADNATNATNAANASNATNAGNANTVGGVGASLLMRKDVASTVTLPLTVQAGSNTVTIGGNWNSGGLWGTNGSGNFHQDADGTKSDGRIYLNWFSGKGVVFGNGAGSSGAEVDASGKVTAASFNGLQIFNVSSGAQGTGHGCDSLCSDNSATCLAARVFPGANANVTSPTTCRTTTPLNSVWTYSCQCGTF